MHTKIKRLVRVILSNALCLLFNFFKIPLSQKYFTCLHASRFIKDKPKKIIHKITFVISSETEFHHRYNVLSSLPKNSFVFIVINHVDILRFHTKEQQLIQIEALKSLISSKFDEEIFDLNAIFSENIEFSLVVGNNVENYGEYYKGFRRKLLFPYFCKKGIKIDEIVGAKGFMLFNSLNEDCNKYFDVIFCVGSFSKNIYDNAYGNTKKILAIGSSRFENLSTSSNLEKYSNKKNIIWLPTHTPVSSLPQFLNVIETLTNYYNVLLKPHSACFDEIFNLNKILTKFPNIRIIKNEINSAELLNIADYVFCDYGGSVFTAIYNDKNVLFLNSDNKDYLTQPYPFGFDSPEVLLRKEIINFDTNCSGNEIIKALQDNNIWEKQKEIRKSIKERFFTITEEPASKKIANKLIEFLNES